MITVMNPKVTVIIPVYNAESILKHCLDSVLDASNNFHELIVVDNCSTDLTSQIILEYTQKDSRVKGLYEPLRSRGAARTAGIRAAEGNIIVMTDADCIVPVNWVNDLIAPIINGREKVVVGNEDDQISNFWTDMQQKANQEFIAQHISQGNYINHLDTKNFAILKTCLTEAGYFSEGIKNLEDFDLKIRLNQLGYKIYFLKDLRVKHNHSDSFLKLLVKRFDQGFWATRIYLRHKDFLKKHPEEMIKSINIINYFAFFPWLIVCLFKRGIKKFIYELISGMAWRVGIVHALLSNEQ